MLPFVPTPIAVTVDLVVLTIEHDALAALVVRRGVPPYRGWWGLPGGFVRPGEDLGAAAARELTEETAVPADRLHLEQLASYGAPGRDPRMRVVTVAHLCLTPEVVSPIAGGDAADARWMPVSRLAGSRMAFDHHAILRDGVERARSKLEYTPLATAFCGPEFTVAQLRRVYEIVWGTTLDARNFHRKVTGTADLIRPTGGVLVGADGGRPARLYVRGRAEMLHPPMLRTGLAHGRATGSTDEK